MQQVKASFQNYAEGLWVHFSKLPQLTINPKQFHQDPAGLYLFPEAFKTEGNWHRFPYRIICRLKPGLRVLDIPKLTRDQIMGLLDAFEFQDMKDDEYLVADREPRAIQDRFWDIIRQRFMGEPGRFNKAWRRQGYDAIFDDGGIIHNAETQLIVLNPRFVEVVEVQEQKGTGYAEVNRVLDEIASRYGNLGEIKIRRPTQSKDWGEKTLRGSIEIRNGDNYAEFTIDPWFVNKDEKIPEAINIRLRHDSKGLTQKWGWGLTLKFRNFDSELKRLTDPKEDVARALKEVFGDETVSALLPIVEPNPGPDFADSSDAYIGPPFGGLGWNTHPMLDDPEMWRRGAPLPAQQFMKDLIPLLSAAIDIPVVDMEDGQIRIELEGKGECEGFLHGSDDIGWWFEQSPDEMNDFPFNEVAILEHIEIEPKYRREGVGTELVRAFCKAAKKGGAQAVFLNASPFGAEVGGGRLTISQIVAFYKSMGFKTWQDQGNSRVMFMDLGKKTKSDFTRDDTSGFYPEGWHDDKSKDPSRLAPDPWVEQVPLALHSATLVELYCDQDGVLSDFDQMFRDHTDKYPHEVESPELWKSIDRIDDFWTGMDWMPDGPELWAFIKPLNPTILSAPSQSPLCIPGKKHWLSQHIGEVPAIFEQAKEKYAGPGKVLIDDRDSNIEKWRGAGGIGILHKSAADTIRQLQELMGDQTEAGVGDWEKEGGYFFKVSDDSKGIWSISVFHPSQSVDINSEEAQDTINYYQNKDGLSKRAAEAQWRELYTDPEHGGKVGYLQMNLEKTEPSPHVSGFPTEPGQAYHVWVHPNYRRKGLAAEMYRMFEKETGIKPLPSPTISYDGKALWEYMRTAATAGKKTESAMETKARRAEAKATLPEDSDLMTFYNMADRAAWADEVNEESKREWNEMTEEEKIERIPEIASHTGWREILNKPYKWDQILDGWLGMRENDAREEAPTSNTFFEDAKIVHNPTLVRFTNYPPTDGIFPGHQPENLGLTVHGQRPGHGDLAFAFNVKELKTLTNKGWQGLVGKYGKHIFKFKVPYAVEADHVSDGERQTVFDVNTVTDLKEIQVPKQSSDDKIKELLEEIPTMFVPDMLKLQKSASFPQNDKVWRAFQKRRKELVAQEKRWNKIRKTL